MAFLLIPFAVSLLLTLAIIRSASRHEALSADHMQGPQKFHARSVPRVGGVGVFIALLIGAMLAVMSNSPQSTSTWLLFASAIPAFASGLAEDLTKKVSPSRRLLFTALSAILGIWLLDGTLVRTAIPGVDLLMPFIPFAMALTVFVVAGVANAVNIIDGFNGLATMCVMLILLAVTYVAHQVGDAFIVTASMIVIGAVLGFFVWNFPKGHIFLGDGGAYLLGFLVAELVALLLHRNPRVSPMFALLSCAYPIYETIFSIYRKKFIRHMSPGEPDGVHMHMLVYKRLMRWDAHSNDPRIKTRRNSLTSPYLWLLCAISVVPSVIWWNNTGVLATFLIGFMVLYTVLYWRIVRFKAPRWLVIRRAA